MMRALANGQGLKSDDLKTFITATLGREVHTTGELTKRDATLLPLRTHDSTATRATTNVLHHLSLASQALR